MYKMYKVCKYFGIQYISRLLLVIGLLGNVALANEKGMKFEFSVLHDDGLSAVNNIFDKRKVILKDNDKFKVSLKAITELTAYLFYISSNLEVSVLSSSSLKPFQTSLFLPNKEEWYQFEDAKGTEKFILIVSKKRLDALDIAIENFRANTKRNSNILIEEIKRQKLMNSSMASEKVRAIEVGGVVRGKQEIDENPVFIETDNFFTKTYRFEHE